MFFKDLFSCFTLGIKTFLCKISLISIVSNSLPYLYYVIERVYIWKHSCKMNTCASKQYTQNKYWALWSSELVWNIVFLNPLLSYIGFETAQRILNLFSNILISGCCYEKNYVQHHMNIFHTTNILIKNVDSLDLYEILDKYQC